MTTSGQSPAFGAVRRIAKLINAGDEVAALLGGAALVFAIRLAGAALTYASMVLLARWLGAFEFGVYAYVAVVITLLGLALSFGFNSSTMRFVPSYLARKRLGRVAGFLKTSYGIVIALSTLGSLILALALFTWRDAMQPYYVAPMFVGLLCVPIWTLLNQFEATARAFGWMHISYVPGFIVRPVVLITFVGVWVLLGSRPGAVIALIGLTVSCMAAALAQGLMLHGKARTSRRASVRSASHTRHWIGVSLGFLAIDGLRMLLDNTDILLIGRLLDPHSVAIYFAVVRTSGFVAFISFSILALAVPKFAEIHSRGSSEELQAFVSKVIRLMFWPSLVLAAALLVMGRFVLSLFGPDFVAGYPTMAIVLTGLVLRAATGPVEYLLSVTGHHRDTIRVYVGAAVANIALNLVLIPQYGTVGAAAASYTAMISGNFLLYWLVRKRLGINACVVAFGPAYRAVSARRGQQSDLRGAVAPQS